jgi:hypothetical protein
MKFSCSSLVFLLTKLTLDGGRKLVYGTDVGVYVTERKGKEATRPKRVLENRSVTQIDVLEQHQVLLVLSEKTVYSFPLDAIDTDDSQNALSKRGRRICHANFFKVGICTGQHLVCCVKTSALSSTIKVYEPMDSMTKGKKKSGFAKMLAGGQDVLKPYKEFYIPSDSNSIHFLKSKLCVGCARGFEVVSLETLETQSLLDQADTSLDFVARRESIKPIHIERLASEFLLCYTDFSFFVNRNGWRARQEWVINWEGNPTAFAIFNPYILAFEPNFIEIRHMETAGLVAVVIGKNIRMLHSSTREVSFSLSLFLSLTFDLLLTHKATDLVRLRRRYGGGCYSQSGFLGERSAGMNGFYCLLSLLCLRNIIYMDDLQWSMRCAGDDILMGCRICLIRDTSTEYLHNQPMSFDCDLDVAELQLYNRLCHFYFDQIGKGI